MGHFMIVHSDQLKYHNDVIPINKSEPIQFLIFVEMNTSF